MEKDNCHGVTNQAWVHKDQIQEEEDVVLGWQVEWLQVFFLAAVDITDWSIILSRDHHLIDLTILTRVQLHFGRDG